MKQPTNEITVGLPKMKSICTEVIGSRIAEWGYGGYEDSDALLRGEDLKMRSRASRVEKIGA